MTNDEGRALRRWEAILHDDLRAAACAIGQGQPGLADDLYQEALILLWELDPGRYDESDIVYLRSALRNRMVKYAAREAKMRFWDAPEGELARILRAPKTRRTKEAA